MSADDRRGRGQGPDPRRGGGQGRPKSGGGNRPQSDRRRRPDTRPQKQQKQQKQPRPDARTVALAVMAAVRERNAYANLALPAELRRAKLDTRDAALATELTYGTLRAQGLLDRVI
ncbi:MAG: transcription antitermination factor NusB, partial [Dietzia maris]